MLNALRRTAEAKRTAQQLHARIVARAREPHFYAALHVPDTVDGRFDLVVLHAWLVLEALRTRNMTTLAQRLTDALFDGFDEGLREQGSGDIGMWRRMKRIADAFYGRLQAYSDADGDAALGWAILRNVYRGKEQHADAAAILARYARAAQPRLMSADLAKGEPDFGALPEQET